jgi:hypothetical protein
MLTRPARPARAPFDRPRRQTFAFGRVVAERPDG